MNYLFFYISVVSIWLVLFASIYIKPLEAANIIIATVTAVISLLYDITLGECIGLYHYIAPSVSLLYIIMAGILIYPPANIIYTLFLPKSLHSTAVYSILWIAIMMIFEFASIKAGTVVFTGWSPFPWSPVTYVATYLWVNLLYRNLSPLDKVTS